MANFKEGDIVRLKSGGPKMTVTRELDQYGRVHTSWFAGKKIEHGNFPPTALQPAGEDDEKERD